MSQALLAGPLPQANFDAHVGHACRPNRVRVRPIDRLLLIVRLHMRGNVHRVESSDTKSLLLRRTQSDLQRALQLHQAEPFQHRLARQPAS